MKNGNRIEGLWERKVGIEKAESTLRLARHIRFKQIDGGAAVEREDVDAVRFPSVEQRP